MFFLFVFFLSMLSCCNNKNIPKSDDLKTSKTMNLNIYKRVSENRIIDSLKIADVPYIYDYEVSSNKKVNIDTITASRLEMLVNDDTNFYD